MGALFSMDTSGSNLMVEYSFASGASGHYPEGSLVSSGTMLYGVTRAGGANNDGVIFSFDTATQLYQKLYDFDGTNGSNPYEGLSAGSDGKLYGITAAGGAHSGGVIFSIDPSTGTYTKLYDMAANASSMGPLSLYHDKFYGLTLYDGANGSGVFFCFDPASGTYTDIHDYSYSSYDGFQSPGRMVVYNDILYGVCAGGDEFNSNTGYGYGQLFSYNDAGSGYTPLFNFTTSQYEPMGIALYNNILYGVTYEGGVYSWGGVFSFDPASGAYNELTGFNQALASSEGNIIAYNNKLVGIGSSCIYQVTLDGNGTLSDLQDFSSVSPQLNGAAYGALLLPAAAAPPNLWGITSTGGANSVGAVFSVNTDGSKMQVAYNFLNDGVDGKNPYGALTEWNNVFYGTTGSGGVNGYGTLFSYNPSGAGTYKKLVDLGGTSGTNNGSTPRGGLVTAGKLLYGITKAGGTTDGGVIFSFDPTTGLYTDLFDMADATGTSSDGPLTLYKGILYGLTNSGGENNYGVIFSFDPGTGTYTDLYDLNYSTGSNPFGDESLVAYNGLLYGVANAGGVNGYGVIFSFDPAARQYTDVHDFALSTGGNPRGIVLLNNVIYGATQNGVGSGSKKGAFFSFDPSGNIYKDLYDFSVNGAANGSYPTTGPIVVNGKLVGIARSNGGKGYGTIYQYDTLAGTLTDLLDFSNTDGNSPLLNKLLLVAPITAGTTPQTILNMSNMVKTYGDADFDPGATADSKLTVTYTSSDKTVASVVGSKIHIAGAGTCTITASQKGNKIYAEAADVTDTLIVNKAPLLITADNKTVNQLQPLPVLTAHYTGFVNKDTVSSLITAPVISTNATSSSAQGPYTITVGGAASNNYAITYANGVLTIIGQLQVFTITDTVKTYGDADFVMGTSNSGLSFTYKADSADIATDAGNDKLHIAGAGTTRVLAQQAGNAEWAPQTDSVILMVNQAPLTITAVDTTIIYGRQNPVFTFTYQGFVNGEGPSILTAIPMIASTAPSSGYANPGTYLIEASGAVSQNYAFTYINGVYTVTLSTDQLNAYCSAPGSLTVNILSTKTRKAGIIMYSLAGQKVLYSDVSLQNGFNQFILPVNLSTGVYVIKVEGDSDSLQLGQKVMITR
jgi:uncharacterized repeat protein (TIGR03803 family)